MQGRPPGGLRPKRQAIGLILYDCSWAGMPLRPGESERASNLCLISSEGLCFDIPYEIAFLQEL